MSDAPVPVTTGEAARHLNVSGETVRRWAHSGYLRHTLLPSGRLRFDIADLDEALRKVERQPTRRLTAAGHAAPVKAAS